MNKRPTAENSERVFAALERFGAPVRAHGVEPEHFASAGDAYRFFWAGDPTIWEFNIHWVDEDEDSTVCGGRGEQCCFLDNDSCDWGQCGQDEADTCSGRGRSGESCCDNDVCDSGSICDGGACVTVPECDGGLVLDGGNFGETVPVEMGQASGRAVFKMYTQDAPDRMTLRDSNGSPLVRTPCIGTLKIQELAAACERLGLDLRQTCVLDSGDKCFFGEGYGSRTCTLVDGWTCEIDTGVCSHQFEYSGGSTLTVEVEPNCQGTPDTYWAFEVTCP